MRRITAPLAPYCPCHQEIQTSKYTAPILSPSSRSLRHASLRAIRYYANLGSGAPEACPPGTASSLFGLFSADDCPDCTPGFYCPESGTYTATLECTEGFYCTGGDTDATEYERVFGSLFRLGLTDGQYPSVHISIKVLHARARTKNYIVDDVVSWCL